MGDDEALREKLRRFLAQLETLRSRVPYTPIHELITQILEETGYGGYASAMPGGVQRRANLEMLVEKAVEFEATITVDCSTLSVISSSFRSMKSISAMVNIYGESADTVRIMSIHKSKGLEFPVVFLSGMGKSFNQMDSRAALVLHSRMGIGADAIDPEHRVRQATLPRQIIRQSMKLENLAEELRGALRCHDAPEGEADYDGHGVEAGEPREAVRGTCGAAGGAAVISDIEQCIRVSRLDFAGIFEKPVFRRAV